MKGSLVLAALALVLGVFSASREAHAGGSSSGQAQGGSNAQLQQLQRIDPPVQTDPVGNAIIGGAVSGTLNGSAAAAAAGYLRSLAIGTAVQAAHGSAAPAR